MTSSTAPLWRRLAAMVYDSFILLALSMLYGAFTAALHVAIYGNNTEHNYEPMMQGPWLLIGWLLCLAGFYLFFWYRAGQTVGMRAWRLQLIQADGSTPELKNCLIRVICAPISLLIFGLGYLWALVDKDRDCLHDKLSATRVLYTPKPK